ncbi:tetratricopeptide repeat protein [Synechocystis sp. PCC 7509]|uniref:tetratricopeptide repeat protein n=1 Tax=Synechocystis sp. PCC 7509 TaxID=927677 RepID=UPI0002ACCA13|nr:tetratricopeptide repeat protein [Synechocystis sp. PCC 7509]
MIETSGQTHLIAAVVVAASLIALAFFVWEGITMASLYDRGVKLYQKKDYKSAESVFVNVLSRHPSNDIARLLLGESLMGQNKIEEAVTQFTTLIARAPKNAEAQVRLATAFMKLEKLPEATLSLEKAQNLFKSQRNEQKSEQIEQLLQSISANKNI